MTSLWLVYSQGIVCSVEPKQQDVDDPNMIEVNEQMPKQLLLVIRLEKCSVPIDVVKMHETLCQWNIDKTSLTE